MWKFKGPRLANTFWKKGTKVLDLHYQMLRFIKNVQGEFNTDAKIYRRMEQNMESINRPPHKDFQMTYD